MIFYVDGACSGNGSDHATGAFGVIGIDPIWNINLFDHYEYSENTTNNREELKAIFYVMRNFGGPPNVASDWDRIEHTVYSDSAYAVNTFTDWMFRWARNDWKKSDGKIPENLDIIQAYYELYQKGYRIDLQKVKGHAKGETWNNQADKLARTGTYDYILEDKYLIKDRNIE